MKFCPQCAAELALTEQDGKTRPRCTLASCDYVYWDNPTPVVAAIVELDGLIVFHVRACGEINLGEELADVKLVSPCQQLYNDLRVETRTFPS